MKDLIADVERYEAGVLKLQNLIQVGQGMRAEKDRALAQASEQLAVLESALKELEATKTTEEALEKAEQDKRAPPPPATTEETPAVPAVQPPTPESASDKEEATQEEKFPYPKEYQYKAEEKKTEEEKFPYPAEYAYKAEGEKEGEKTEEEAGNGEDTEPELSDATPQQTTPPEPVAPVVEKFVSPTAEAARTAFREKENEVRNARDTRDRLQKELAHDFGAQGEYMSLLGSCFDVQVRQYTYEACPYGNAAQKEGGSSTSLGTWAGFEKKENGQVVMKFAGGQRCWQGPERSFLVDVQCGVDNQLSNVDEPSKCVYTAKLVTPAACSESQAKALREQLNGMLAAQA